MNGGVCYAYKLHASWIVIKNIFIKYITMHALLPDEDD